MQATQIYDKVQLRELASMVSHAAFKKLSSETNQSNYIRRMKKYVGWEMLDNQKPKSLDSLIAYAYNILEQNYRHEYLYKNKLLNDYVLRHYALEDTILLNEFRIGQSIADAVLINGTNKVFEIKTELDTPDRLLGQLHDYYKVFTEVYVFTHASLKDKYLRILPEYVGLLIYTEDSAVLEYRKASVYNLCLNAAAMMASLRKAEYGKLVKQLVGFVPDTTPVFHYQACLEVLQALPVEEVQHMYCKVLKQRISPEINNYLQEGAVPQYMKFSFYLAKFNKKSYFTMINNLNKNLL